MELLEALEEFSEAATRKDASANWFTGQSVNELAALPFSAELIPPNSRATLLKLFEEYAVFWVEFHHDQKFPFSLYKARQQACSLALLIGKAACPLWETDVLEWLRLCHRSSSDDRIAFFFTKYKIDPEEQIRRTILDEASSQTFRLREEFTEEWALPYLRQLKEWFQHRYELDFASKLAQRMPPRNRMAMLKSALKELFSKDLFFRLTLAYAFVVILLLFVSFIGLYKDTTVMYPWRSVKYLSPFANLARFAVTILYVVSLSLLFSRRVLAVVLPRLIGGILVGYLFLVSSDAMVSFAVGATPYTVVMIGMVSTALSFLFLVYEVRRRIVGRTEAVLRRTGSLFFLSLIESTVLGLFLCDMFSDIFRQHFATLHNLNGSLGSRLADASDLAGSFYGPLAGTIYPKVLVLYVPLALLVGIVLQLFWEEKPISEL